MPKPKKEENEEEQKIQFVPRAVSVPEMFNAITDMIGAQSAKIDELLKIAKEE